MEAPEPELWTLCTSTASEDLSRGSPLVSVSLSRRATGGSLYLVFAMEYFTNQMLGSLIFHEPRSLDICRRCGDQLLLSQKAAQRKRPKPLIQADAGSSRKTGVSKTRTTTLHTESDFMVQHYVKTVEKHLRKLVCKHQRF